jgi:uncharacterized protein (TIGR00251 family)
MIDLQQQSDGVMLPVRVQPGARRNGIVGAHGGALKIAVTQAPEKGKANEGVVEELCAALKLRRAQVELISGATARQKRFLIRGIGLEDLRGQIEAAIASKE